MANVFIPRLFVPEEPMSPLLDIIEKIAARVRDGKTSPADASAFLRRLVNGPAATLIVKLTPNPYDDLLLEFLKALYPPV